MAGLRTLTGRPEDYREPVAAVTRCIAQLIHDYGNTGGDLGSVQITVIASPDGDVRGTEIRLSGFKI